MADFDYTSRNKRWRHLRRYVLKRDVVCQESKRYGKIVPAVIVHHIWPAEDYPEYAYCLWNLVGLSEEAHNKMHVRGTKQLSEAGLRWQRRTPPPSS